MKQFWLDASCRLSNHIWQWNYVANTTCEQQGLCGHLLLNV